MDESKSIKTCVFADYLKSCSDGNKTFSSKSLSAHQQTKIVSCSKAREDDFHSKITGMGLAYHTSCYASYTSAVKIEKHIASLRKRKSSEQHINTTTPSSSKRLRSRYLLLYITFCIYNRNSFI